MRSGTDERGMATITVTLGLEEDERELALLMHEVMQEQWPNITREAAAVQVLSAVPQKSLDPWFILWLFGEVDIDG